MNMLYVHHCSSQLLAQDKGSKPGEDKQQEDLCLIIYMAHERKSHSFKYISLSGRYERIHSPESIFGYFIFGRYAFQASQVGLT